MSVPDSSLPEGLPGEPNSTGWQPMEVSLPGVGVLGMMSEKALADLSTYGEYKPVQDGETIINEGRDQGRLYIVISGQLDVVGTADGREVPLARISEGECFGEASLLIPAPASATVRAVDSGSLWSMDREGLRRYLAEHAGGGGALMMGMAQCLATRLRSSNDQIIQHFMAQARALSVPRRAGNRPISAPVTDSGSGFFSKLKSTFAGSAKKPQISTEIKL